MRVAFFSTKPHDRQFLSRLERSPLEFHWFEPRLTLETAPLAHGFPAVSIFVHDEARAEVLEILARGGCRLLALRCAGFNQVDLAAAQRLGITVVRVPAYSPYAVAEHTVALLLTLNRKIHRAHNRVREGNFSLDGLMGFDLHGRTVGTLGLGKIGQIFLRIMAGFGCKLLAYDPFVQADLGLAGVQRVDLDTLWAQADILSLHCPLNPGTHHILNAETFAKLKPGCLVLNTSRGALIETQAAIEAIKSGHLGGLALDVYEEEEGVFYEDLSNQIIPDDTLMRLMTFPNVLITSHQAFFTREAVENIAVTTVESLWQFAHGQTCLHEVRL